MEGVHYHYLAGRDQGADNTLHAQNRIIWALSHPSVCIYANTTCAHTSEGVWPVDQIGKDGGGVLEGEESWGLGEHSSGGHHWGPLVWSSLQEGAGWAGAHCRHRVLLSGRGAGVSCPDAPNSKEGAELEDDLGRGHADTRVSSGDSWRGGQGKGDEAGTMSLKTQKRDM